VAQPDDRAMVPVLRAGSEDLAAALRDHRSLKVAIDGLELRFPIPLHAAEILRTIDGKRTIAELHTTLSGKIDALGSWDAFKPAFDRVYNAFNNLNRLFLQRGAA